ncbi:MAG: RHS repeat-associated core domain-containing protein [Methanocellales archaeon]
MVILILLAPQWVELASAGICQCNHGFVWSSLEGKCILPYWVTGDRPGMVECNSELQTATSDPVIITSGNLILKYRDLYIPNARGPSISIERSYNSQSIKGSSFGYGWNFNYEMFLTEFYSNETVELKDEEGNVIDTINITIIKGISITQDHGREDIFLPSPSPNKFLPPAGVYDTLERLEFHPKGYLYVLMKPDGTKYFFDEKRRLSKIEDRNGGYLDFEYPLSYTGYDFLPIKISDNSGHSIKITYEDYKIKTIFVPGGISFPEGRTIIYNYEGAKLKSVTDAEGNTESYDYHPTYSTLVKRTLPMGGSYDYTYEFANYYGRVVPKLISQRDPEGNVKSYFYDWESKPMKTTITDNRMALGHESETKSETRYYNSPGSNVIKITNALGQSETYDWDENYNMRELTDPFGEKQSGTRDSGDRLIEKIDQLNRKLENEFDKFGQIKKQSRIVNNTVVTSVSYGYDDSGNLANITDGDGNTHSFTYNKYGQPTLIVDAEGHKTTFEYYDDIGYLKKVTDELGNTISYTYDEVGNILSETRASADGSQSAIIRYEYNKNSAVTKITDPAGRVTTYSYNRNGYLEREINVYKGVTNYIYYKNNLLKSIEKPSGRIVTYTYYADGFTKTITEGDGIDDRTTSYEYDDSGRITKIINPDGGNVTYIYDPLTNKVTSIDPMGNPTIYLYDEIGREIEVIDAYGNSTKTIYDDEHLKKIVIDKLGYKTTYSYNKMFLLSAIEDALGNQETLAYDKLGNLRFVKEKDGNVTEYVYDPLDRVKWVKDPLGNKLVYDYDYLGNIIAVKDENGNIYRMGYDSAGRITYAMDPMGNREIYTYDDEENMVTVTDARGHATNRYFDTSGRLYKVVEYVGSKEINTLFYYDVFDNVKSISIYNGKETAYYDYDKMDRLVLVNQSHITMTYSYDKNGNLLEIKGMNGVTTHEYDRLNRIIKTHYPDGSNETIIYDANNNKIKIIDVTGRGTEYEYNSLRQPVKIINQLGFACINEYDKIGQLTRTIDENDMETRYSYDAVGRLTQILNPDGTSVKYEYDAAGNKIKTIDENNNIITYSYDKNGRLTSITDPLGYRSFFEYDANGNCVKKIDANGNTIKHEYDELNRISKTILPDLSEILYEYDIDGKLLVIREPNATYYYTYDAQRRLIEENCTEEKWYIKYEYDKLGYITGIESLGYNYTFEYSNNYALSKIYAPEGVYTFKANPFGQIAEVAYPNGVTTKYSYDPLGRFENILTSRDGEIISNYTFERDGAGNIIRQIDGNNITTYKYDSRYRLTNVSLPGMEISYQYDAAGNRIKAARNNITIDYTYNAANQLLTEKESNAENSSILSALLNLISGPTRSYTYDKNGNLILKVENGNTTIYDYNHGNKIIKITHPDLSTEEFKYNSRGKRIYKKDSNGVTKYVYKGDNVLFELDEDHNIKARYTSSNIIDNILSKNLGGKAQYLHYNGIGSVVKITDESGSPVGTFDYYPFGEIIGRTGEARNITISYTGREFEENSRLYYYRNRFYDPSTGRFTTMDPFPSDIQDTSTLHRYVYARNNPIIYNDPLGLFPSVAEYWDKYIMEPNRQFQDDGALGKFGYYSAETATFAVSFLGFDPYAGTRTAQALYDPCFKGNKALAIATDILSVLPMVGMIGKGVKGGLKLIGNGGKLVTPNLVTKAAKIGNTKITFSMIGGIENKIKIPIFSKTYAVLKFPSKLKEQFIETFLSHKPTMKALHPLPHDPSKTLKWNIEMAWAESRDEAAEFFGIANYKKKVPDVVAKHNEAEKILNLDGVGGHHSATIDPNKLSGLTDSEFLSIVKERMYDEATVISRPWWQKSKDVDFDKLTLDEARSKLGGYRLGSYIPDDKIPAGHLRAKLAFEAEAQKRKINLKNLWEKCTEEVYKYYKERPPPTSIFGDHGEKFLLGTRTAVTFSDAYQRGRYNYKEQGGSGYGLP